MGDAVFGNPITNSMLEAMPDFNDKPGIGRIDRARVALALKNAEEKNANALQYLEKQKEKCGLEVATLCLIYNATGDTLEYTGHHDWHGHVGASPYPVWIANGQWGAFLHTIDKNNPRSTGAVVYRGKNANDYYCDWMASWDNYQWDDKGYIEAREQDHFASEGVWDIVYNYMQKSGIHCKDTWGGCLSFASIGNHDYPIYTAILTLADAYVI